VRGSELLTSFLEVQTNATCDAKGMAEMFLAGCFLNRFYQNCFKSLLQLQNYGKHVD